MPSPRYCRTKNALIRQPNDRKCKVVGTDTRTMRRYAFLQYHPSIAASTYRHLVRRLRPHNCEAHLLTFSVARSPSLRSEQICQWRFFSQPHPPSALEEASLPLRNVFVSAISRRRQIDFITSTIFPVMSSYFRLHIQLLLHILIFIDKRFSPQPYSKLFEEGYGEEHFSPKKFLPIIIPPPHKKKEER